VGDENEAHLTFSIAEELTVAVLIYSISGVCES
jgi:hypothetical protein